MLPSVTRRLRLRTIPEILTVCKLPSDEPPPLWACSSPFWSITRTSAELSIVCAQSHVPPTLHTERAWRGFEVAGPLAFDMVGVLASLAVPLANAAVSIFTLSTFDTDILLVPLDSFEKACQALRDAGHVVETQETEPGIRHDPGAVDPTGTR